ncbi:MAG: substrate-binding domain-containing protein [Chloroflexi bacterium]|nr:substrate-binding domain-containing protein [Chloroflexota bacterium]
MADNNKAGVIELPNKRLTVGLLGALWDHTKILTKKRGVHQISFACGEIGSTVGFDAQANVLTDLIGEKNVDGLVIWSDYLGHYVNADEMKAFCEQFYPLPIVSIGLVQGVPSVLVDNYQGVFEAVSHLIQVHGRRRIACIRGPEGNVEADQRYKAYVDAMEQHNIPLDPACVVVGGFAGATGVPAMRTLLDERQATFDALVTSTDEVAIVAIKALQDRGMQVPDDVSVVGFDDDGEYWTPPVTSVHAQWYEANVKAADLIIALLAGEQVPEQTVLPSRMVVRQSCGCPSGTVRQIATGRVAQVGEDEQGLSGFIAQRQDVLAAMIQAVEHSIVGLDDGWETCLLDAFIADWKRPDSDDELDQEFTDGFIIELDQILRQVVAGGNDVMIWLQIVSVLRRCVLPHLTDHHITSRLEDLWQQANVLIGEMARRVEMTRRVQAGHQAQQLRQIGQKLITSFDVDSVFDALVEELPHLGIEGCYLCLYEDPAAPTEWTRLVLAYDERGRIPLSEETRRFSAPQLMPEGLLPYDMWDTLLVESLYFREDQIGFVLFKPGTASRAIFGTLREQISSALKGALLLQDQRRAEQVLAEAYSEVEQQVRERTVALELEIAERERVQAESLQLQQQVIDAQKQALQELSTPIIPVMDRILVMPLIGSIDSMRARDITRALLAGIRVHRARIVILDITGVPIVDSGVANHLNKTIQAARLKGSHTIITGISDAVAETIVELGIDWGGVETLADLETGLKVALTRMGLRIGRVSAR